MNRRSIWSYSGAPAINLDDPQSVARVQGAEERERLRADAAHERFRRGLRRKLFGPNLFGEPGWDILLALYVIDDVERWMSIAELTSITHVPLTTSLRWLAYLEDQDFVSRSTAPGDQRMVLVELTDDGRRAMESYLSHAREPVVSRSAGVD